MTLFVVLLIGAIVAFIARRSAPKSKISFLPWVLLLFAAASLVYTAAVVIPPGHVGVQVLFGNVLDHTLENGLHIVNPFISVVEMDVKTQAYTMSAKEADRRGSDGAIETLSSDGLTIRLELTVQYRLSAAQAAQVYRSIGEDYVEKVVRPEVRSAIRDAAVSYVATDLYSTKRGEFMQHVRTRLEHAFRARGIVHENTLLRDIELPKRVRAAIDEKIAAEQEAQKMVYVLNKEKQEADRKRVEAGGIADAQRIISSSLTNPYLQYNYIQTLRALADTKNATFVIAPMDQKLTPMLNVR
jgi:regulator of protease activity HflC (stomatin/prohibitin superfamily)